MAQLPATERQEPERPLDRRARYRAQTRDEVKQIALRQIATAGLGALSLNGVARELGVTGPALYRYFASRDDLLAELVANAYDDLADAVEAADASSRTADGRDRLRALAAAYRAWALAQPHRYLLLFGAPVGSGALAPERTIPAAHRTMSALLAALDGLVATPSGDDDRPRAGDEQPIAELDRQLEAWLEQRAGPRVGGPVARLGVALWTRLHGILSLELAGHFASMGFDPALLYAAECEALLDQAVPRSAKTRSVRQAPPASG